MDAPIENSKYNATGIAQTGPAMNKSPLSNPGVVYQPANKPTNPGALKVATTTSQNLIFKMSDSGTINVGNQNNLGIGGTSVNPYTGVIVYDPLGNPCIFIEDQPPYFQIISPASTNNILPMIFLQNQNQQVTPVAEIASTAVTGTHFNQVLFLDNSVGGDQIAVWTSDGTTPNGNLGAGNTGDICLNGPSGQPFYCSGGSVWVGM